MPTGMTGRLLKISGICFTLFFLCLFTPCRAEVSKGFVDVKDIVPSIVLDIRYYTSYNFVGTPIAGYSAPKCLLTRKAALALERVQRELSGYSFSLKLYDCYRPKRAVDHFIRWAKDAKNTKMKKEFYPTVRKSDLFKKGYIAKKSAHSRGSAVDLTIVPIPLPIQETYTEDQELCECHLPAEKRFKDNSIDMGTGFDCFHPLSWTESKGIGPKQRQNRFMLKSVMEKYGFRNYRKEWWHYTLIKEPFPNTYFDFIVK
jgi:D-alanyl-D-alanine dipeptidase